MAYQDDLLMEMQQLLANGIANQGLWLEICVIADFTLRASRGAIKGRRRAMSLAVVGERALCLDLSSLLEIAAGSRGAL